VDYVFGENKLPAECAGRRTSREDPRFNLQFGSQRVNKIDCEFRGVEVKKVSGRVLTAPAMNSHNSFDSPNVVKPETFKDVSLSGGKLTATLPAKSVVVFEIE
jgi:alpha-N-arabinofuranosidase